ncbi:MAG: biopolymer transporter ExbD [Hahellaceae bacterium]|nr:biopolymer transporter ExbD [Hahellaceae bacterium]
MKQSAKAKRHQRHYRRSKKNAGLNLVSLMDIFTILVFFLMVNSSDVQVLNQNANVQLPLSVADQMPKDTLVLAVTENDILVSNRPVVRVHTMKMFSGYVEPNLKAELEYQSSRARAPAPPTGRPITIVADRELPYELLKKIMSTCVDAGYSSISLAVNRKAEEQGV